MKIAVGKEERWHTHRAISNLNVNLSLLAAVALLRGVGLVSLVARRLWLYGPRVLRILTLLTSMTTDPALKTPSVVRGQEFASQEPRAPQESIS